MSATTPTFSWPWMIGKGVERAGPCRRTARSRPGRCACPCRRCPRPAFAGAPRRARSSLGSRVLLDPEVERAGEGGGLDHLRHGRIMTDPRVSAAEAAQEVVHHPVGHDAGELAAEHEAEVERADERLRREIGVGVGPESPRVMPRATMRATSSRRACTTVARKGSPSEGLMAIWESRARITGPKGVSVSACTTCPAAARSSTRVSPHSSTARWGAASSRRSSRASASLDGHRR